MLGYWNDPEKTAETFRGGWLHTGDLGIMDDEGYLTVVDRIKDMIKTGGENVASREVEEVIHEHPAVAEVAVFGVEHPKWIEAVTAAVVPRPGQSLTKDELLAFCRGRLAGFKTPSTSSSSTSCPRTRAARSSSASCGRRGRRSRPSSAARDSAQAPHLHPAGPLERARPLRRARSMAAPRPSPWPRSAGSARAARSPASDPRECGRSARRNRLEGDMGRPTKPATRTSLMPRSLQCRVDSRVNGVRA